jgi:hypothetical protein
MPVEPEHRTPGQSRLSRPERQQRGRIAMATRLGLDTTGPRLLFDELKAERELREAVERLVAARRGQGFKDRIQDSTTLLRIATLIAAPPASAQPDKRNGHRVKPPMAAVMGGGHDHDHRSS